LGYISLTECIGVSITTLRNESYRVRRNNANYMAITDKTPERDKRTYRQTHRQNPSSY